MRRITTAQRRGRMLARHWLTGEGQHAGADGVADALIALHATDAATVYLSARARVPDLAIEHVDKSLYDDRSLVRMLGMRRTMFVVPARTRPVVQAGCTDDVAARLRRALVSAITEAGITPDADAWLAGVAASVLSELTARADAGGGTGAGGAGGAGRASGGGMTAAELSRAEPRLSTKIVVAEGKSYGGEVSLTSRILNLMSAEGLIIRGRPRGGWTSTQYEWAAASGWLTEPAGLTEAAAGPAEPTGLAEPVTAGQARVELAGRWLRAFGPAPVSDLKWWTGWTAGQVRQALGQLRTAEADLDGQPGIMLAGDDDFEEMARPAAALLPALDPTPMGWQDRDWMFSGPQARHRELLFDRSGNIGPTIWWQGFIAGGWAQRADGEIAVRLLEDIGADGARLVRAEADRLSRWMGRNRFVPKFRTPLERELSK